MKRGISRDESAAGIAGYRKHLRADGEDHPARPFGICSRSYPIYIVWSGIPDGKGDGLCGFIQTPSLAATHGFLIENGTMEVLNPPLAQ